MLSKSLHVGVVSNLKHTTLLTNIVTLLFTFIVQVHNLFILLIIIIIIIIIIILKFIVRKFHKMFKCALQD